MSHIIVLDFFVLFINGFPVFALTPIWVSNAFSK